MIHALLLCSISVSKWNVDTQNPKSISLADAIQIAQKHSPLLQSAVFEAESAKFNARAVLANTKPQLGISGYGSTGNDTAIVSSGPNGMVQNWMLLHSGNFLDGNLGLMVPIFAPRLHAMAGAASWLNKASQFELAEAKAELTLQVTDAYDRCLLAREMVKVQEAKVKASEELVRTTQAQFDAGHGIEASVQRSNAELSRSKRLLTSAKNDEAKAFLDLRANLGVDLTSPLALSDSLVTHSNDVDLDHWLKKARTERGMLLANRARESAAAEDIRSARAQKSPQVNGSLMGDTSNRSDMGGISAAVFVSFPLLDGGRIDAETSQAIAMKGRAHAKFLQSELMVEKEVRQAWLDLQTAGANIASSEASLRSAESAYQIIELRVKAGKSLLVEQLDALSEVSQAKADLAQSTYDQLLALARLHRAAGGSL